MQSDIQNVTLHFAYIHSHYTKNTSALQPKYIHGSQYKNIHVTYPKKKWHYHRTFALHTKYIHDWCYKNMHITYQKLGLNVCNVTHQMSISVDTRTIALHTKYICITHKNSSMVYSTKTSRYVPKNKWALPQCIRIT